MNHDHKSENRDNLNQLLDSCRGKQDLHLAEMQPLAAALQADPAVIALLQKSQRIDDLVGRSIRDVPVPAGLHERLLARLQNSPSAISTEGLDAVSRQTADASVVFQSSPGDVTVAKPVASTRRRVLFTGIAGVAAAALLGLFAYYDSPPRFSTPSDVATETAYWLSHLDAGKWERAKEPPLKGFPLPKKPAFGRLYGWQWGQSSHSSLSVACYNIRPNGAVSHLFVCRGARTPRLPNSPDPKPSANVDGWQLGTWHANGLVYVLAVHGTVSQYQELVGYQPRIALLGSPQPKA